MKINLWLVLSIILAALTLAAYLIHTGGAQERNRQVVAQAKHSKQVRKTYDKIDRETPFYSDKQRALEWLYQYGRSE